MKVWCWLATTLLLTGCGFQKVYTVPPWIYAPPQTEKYIYVTGSSGKSISPFESKELAIQNGLTKLAQVVGTEVFVNISERTESGRATWEGGNAIETRTSAALKRAMVVKFWADPDGEAGLGYRVFVLLRVKKSDIIP